jgi:hypothetical protein
MVSWAEGSRSAVRTAVWEHGAGSTLLSRKDAPGLHGVVVIVR